MCGRCRSRRPRPTCSGRSRRPARVGPWRSSCVRRGAWRSCCSGRAERQRFVARLSVSWTGSQKAMRCRICAKSGRYPHPSRERDNDADRCGGRAADPRPRRAAIERVHRFPFRGRRAVCGRPPGTRRAVRRHCPAGQLGGSAQAHRELAHDLDRAWPRRLGSGRARHPARAVSSSARATAGVETSATRLAELSLWSAV